MDNVAFRSILFDGADGDAVGMPPEPPDFVADLHLDDIVGSITARRDIYNLAPLFYASLRDVETIAYRHEVFRDLEQPVVLDLIRAFAGKMREMRDHRAHADRVRYRHEKERWFVEAAVTYCTAVGDLSRGLVPLRVRSRGLAALRDFLADYTGSAAFSLLLADTERLVADLQAITYRVHISGSRITVSGYRGEPDYGAEVLATFEKFKQQASKEYRFDVASRGDLNHVEAAVLDRVAQLHPDVFATLDEYAASHADYLEATIARFDREVQFYVAYLEYMERFMRAGLAFCYPAVSRSKEIFGHAVFDVALAERLVREEAPVVTNDFYLEGPERILVVSGPNQGGKTTFARTVGQMHHLASIGCPVPGTESRLFLVDGIFTHFEREEDLENLSGKLEDDLRRLHWILARVTADSLVIMNESFNSTTLHDALFLNAEVMRAIIRDDLLAVAVTFLDELASLGPTTVSMVSTVDPDEPTRRTFKLVRRPADGLAYAAAIAERYHLTYERVRARIPR